MALVWILVQQAFIFYILNVCRFIMPGSILKTNKSLLMCGLFHGTTDGIGAFFPVTAASMGQGPNAPTLLLEIITALLMIPYLLRLKPT